MSFDAGTAVWEGASDAAPAPGPAPCGLAERLLRNSFLEPESGCWIWLGRVNNWGYPTLSVYKPDKNSPATVFAHRISYELFKGPIPAGFHVDHTCRVLRCIAPDHLEAVTEAENQRRRAAATYA